MTEPHAHEMSERVAHGRSKLYAPGNLFCAARVALRGSAVPRCPGCAARVALRGLRCAGCAARVQGCAARVLDRGAQAAACGAAHGARGAQAGGAAPVLGRGAWSDARGAAPVLGRSAQAAACDAGHGALNVRSRGAQADVSTDSSWSWCRVQRVQSCRVAAGSPFGIPEGHHALDGVDVGPNGWLGSKLYAPGKLFCAARVALRGSAVLR
jgi:hypothetical protein